MWLSERVASSPVFRTKHQPFELDTETIDHALTWIGVDNARVVRRRCFKGLSEIPGRTFPDGASTR